MPSTFSNWANGESASARTRNGEPERGDLAMETARSSSFEPVNPPVERLREQLLDELREELAVARRRLQYFEGFAPWIEEQMSAVVERAAEVKAESEREEEQFAAEIENRRDEVERLTAQRDRLRDEAQTIVAHANATAEGVIREANARAARLLVEAHREADAIVSRLRDEAVAIVSRALGDLGALETTNTNDVGAHSTAPVVERLPFPRGEVQSEWSRASEDEDPRGIAQRALESIEPTVTHDAPGPDDVWPGSVVADEEATGHEAPPAVVGASGPTSEGEHAPGPGPSASKETVDEPDDEPGPFQWLRSALAGRDASPPNGASDIAQSVPSVAQDGDQSWQGVEPSSDDVFVTQVTMHPAFASTERAELQHAVEGLPGVERVALGAVTDDSFDLLVTHKHFTSVLGSLLTAAGEHVRLIAQHDDSLEVEITGLEWLHGAGGSDARRAIDA